MTVVVMNAWAIFYRGGPMMWPLLFLSIIALAVGINRLLHLSAIERRLSDEKNLLLGSLRQGRLKETLRVCDQQPGILSSILKQGILKFGSSRDLIKGTMEEIFDYEHLRLRKYMDVLSVIVNLAPLMGLLGTVNAMAVVFYAVQVRSNALSPLTAGELASGIWQALLTTSAGLVVGILSYAMHAFCAMRINALTAYIQRSITEMANILQQLAELKHAGQESGHER